MNELCVIAREAKPTAAIQRDCFVAVLLVKTSGVHQ
jgi:hypothetical protein